MNNAMSIITEKKNHVLLGETGSGKTEVGINMALTMAKVGCAVHYFDLDQTKPLFRARELANVLTDGGVTLHYQEQDLDTPTVADGVIEALCDPDLHVILDIGGGSHGSHMIGQFAHILQEDHTEVLYLVNPYRIWSQSAQDIQQTIQKVVGAARLDSFSIIANPNLGADTSVDDILTGVDNIRAMLPDKDIRFLCVRAELAHTIEAKSTLPVFPVSLFTAPEWM